MNKSRRNILLHLPELLFGKTDSAKPSEEGDFSFATWQPLIASVRPFLADEISRFGLATDGKSELELVREVISLQGKSNN